jgi:hypothetical protein
MKVNIASAAFGFWYESARALLAGDRHSSLWRIEMSAQHTIKQATAASQIVLPRSTFVVLTAIAAAAAAASLAFNLPVWAMFIGWVAFFSRGGSGARDGLLNWTCVVLGVAFGIGAALAIGGLSPALGALALPTAVFVVAMVVVSLRAFKPLNNLQGYFLGLIAYFASHLVPSINAFAALTAATAIGSAVGWISHAIQHRMAHANRPH